MSRILLAALGIVMATAACQEANQPAAAAASIRLVPVVEDGLESPLFVTHAGDGSGRLFVVEQPGRIRIVQQGKLEARPFLAIEERITAAGSEQGLLGLAFHPDFARNRRFFVNYTRESDGATVVSEFRTSPRGRARGDSERILLTIPQPYTNHNGGMIAFGPDGLLYIGTGDGGAGGDPENRAQNPDELLGKMLRIDVDAGRAYAIPADNPFARRGGRPEIFALGLRNPWRFSFDRATGELYAADVGQRAVEEVNIVRRGGNYGWRHMEGRRCYNPSRGCRTNALELPVTQYTHRGGRCSITGGYVYRGRAIPGLQGTYVYGDYCSGEVFGLRDGRAQVLLATDRPISSFGENQAGELYLVDHDGALLRIAPGAQ